MTDDADAGVTTGRGRRSVVTVVAVCCIGYGAILALRPSDDTGLLARIIGGGLVLLAVTFLLRASGRTGRRADRLNALLWLGVGGAAVVWSDPTVRGLAIVVGLTLMLTGAVDVLSTPTAERTNRWVTAIGGITSIVLGVAVVSWPTVTTLVLAIAVGVRMVVAGVGLLVDRRSPSHDDQLARRRSPWRLVGPVAGLVLASMVAFVSVAVNRAQPDEPGAFYDRPSGELGPPGTLIRSELLDPYVVGAVVRRILYVTSDTDGQPITASGLVLVPDQPIPPDGRPVLAFTHGTIGIARRCAPSLLSGDAYAPAIPGLAEFLDDGFAVVATDYAGLGSDATTGFLIGASEAYSTLDSVRAAQQIDEVGATPDFVTFGESQGGHAALFTGELAQRYAPELRLRGVAAAAPATDLENLFAKNVGTTFGDVLASYALRSWSDVYGVGLDGIVDTQAQPVVDRLAGLCIQTEAQMIALFPEAELLKLGFLTAPPWETEPWSTILASNTPGATNIDTPLLITQGADDPLVLPEVQRAFVGGWCARGQDIEFRLLPGVGHLDAGHASASAVADWASDRVAGRPWTGNC